MMFCARDYSVGRCFVRAAFCAALGILAGCESGTVTPFCPNMPTAEAVIGQSAFDHDASNAGGIGAATLSSPLGAVASDGQLSYLADTGNNRVLGFLREPDGIAPAADFEIGHGDASGSDFQGRAAGVGATSLSAPSKLSISGDGRLVLADTANNRVLIWNVLPTANTPPDMVVGQPDFDSFRANQQRSTPTAYTLNGPTAALIVNGNLIVADRGNNRVLIWHTVPNEPNAPADVELGQTARRMRDDGTTQVCGHGPEDDPFCFETALAGGDRVDSGDSGDLTESEDGMAPDGSNVDPSNALEPPELGLSAPSDLWSDGYKLLVSDSGNNRVLYWDQIPFINNALYTHILGQDGPGQREPGVGAAGLNAPWGVYSDGSTIYVGDMGNNRVLRYSGFPVRNGSSAFALFGQSSFDTNAANDGDQNGIFGTQNQGRSDLSPSARTLNFPTGVFASLSGKLYVADQANNRVLVFSVADAVNGTVPSLCDGTNQRVN